MRLNQKKTLFESFQQNLHESNYYFKEFNDSNEVDYREFENEQEANDYAEKVNKETGHETAVYKMSNDECVVAFDAKEVTECDKPKKANFKDIFKGEKHIVMNEDIKNGHVVSISGANGPELEKTVYKDYYVLLTSEAGKTFTCQEFDSEYDANDWARRQASYNGFGASVYQAEDDKMISYYDPGDMGSDDDEESSDDHFQMKNLDSDRVVDVYKSDMDGKWHDSDGNRYMGYLSKQDVKSYFKGNWKEV